MIEACAVALPVEARYRDTLQSLNRIEALAVAERKRPRRIRWTIHALGHAHIAHRLAVRARCEMLAAAERSAPDGA